MGKRKHLAASLPVANGRRVGDFGGTVGDWAFADGENS